MTFPSSSAPAVQGDIFFMEPGPPGNWQTETQPGASAGAGSAGSAGTCKFKHITQIGGHALSIFVSVVCTIFCSLICGILSGTWDIGTYPMCLLIR